jgi:hypothetical protein
MSLFFGQTGNLNIENWRTLGRAERFSLGREADRVEDAAQGGMKK